MKALADQLDLAYQLAQTVSARSYLGYLDYVVVNSDPPRRFGLIREPWQTQFYGQLAPAIEQAAGFNNDYRGPLSFWRTMSRGHDKTGSIGRTLIWLLRYSRKPLMGGCAAADSEQAQLICESMKAEAELNPWLNLDDKGRKVFHFGRTRITGPRGVIKILSSDAPTSYGQLFDIFVADELTHWANRTLWEAQWSGRHKRPKCVYIVLTNAGFLGSWQHDLVTLASSDPNWNVYQAPGPQATWMTVEATNAVRKYLLPATARRVIDNEWIDPAEESGLFLPADIQGVVEESNKAGLVYRTKGEIGQRYMAAIDYGPRRDRTALTIMHLDEQRRVVIDKLDVWQGSPESPVRIDRVEAWMDDAIEHFNRPMFVIDPYQMESTIQKYERRGLQILRFEARGGKHTYEMCETLRTLVLNRQIIWYPQAGGMVVGDKIESLNDELQRLIIKHTSYGYRFDHTAAFHDDRAVAVGMGALELVRNELPNWTPPVSIKRKPEPTPVRAHTRNIYGVEVGRRNRS